MFSQDRLYHSLPPKRWAGLFDILPIPVWIAHDAECREVTGNPTAEVLLSSGSEPHFENRQGSPAVAEYLPFLGGKPAKPKSLPMHIAARTGKAIHNAELEYRFRNGRAIQLIGSAIPVFCSEGELSGVISAFVDVSDLRTSNRRASAAEHRAEQVIAGISGMLYEWDPQMRTTPAHIGSSYLLGEELPPASFANWWSDHIHPEDREFVENHRETVRSTIDRDAMVEYRVRHADGAWRWVAERSAPVGSNGLQIGVVFDITSRKKLELELAAMKTNLDQLVEERTSELLTAHNRLAQAEHLASLGAVAAGITHEINNPLAIIQLEAELMSTAENLTTDQRVSLAEVLECCRRISQITAGVLAVGRSEAPVQERHDLCATFHKAVGFARAALFQHHAEIFLEVELNEAWAVHSPVSIEQVIVNLLKNAWEAGATQIRAALVCEDGKACITIQDNGPGIAPEKIDRVFDPFFSTKRAEGGTGLGLAISRRMLEEHGGSLSVHSPPEGGALFEMWLPVCE
jgi:signal transduction histidine kinase